MDSSDSDSAPGRPRYVTSDSDSASDRSQYVPSDSESDRPRSETPDSDLEKLSLDDFADLSNHLTQARTLCGLVDKADLGSDIAKDMALLQNTDHALDNLFDSVYALSYVTGKLQKQIFAKIESVNERVKALKRPALVELGLSLLTPVVCQLDPIDIGSSPALYFYTKAKYTASVSFREVWRAEWKHFLTTAKTKDVRKACLDLLHMPRPKVCTELPHAELRLFLDFYPPHKMSGLWKELRDFSRCDPEEQKRWSFIMAFPLPLPGEVPPSRAAPVDL